MVSFHINVQCDRECLEIATYLDIFYLKSVNHKYKTLGHLNR